MTPAHTLGEFEQLVMLAVLRLEGQAYAASIQRELEDNADRSVTVSTIYVTLLRLEKKGLVRSQLGDPTPVRGGRSKRYYRLTQSGVRALNESHDALERMWNAVKSHPAFKSLG